MGFNKKFFTTGGIVASTPSAAAFDPLQNFETVTYTGNGSTQKITGYIRKGAAFNGSSRITSNDPVKNDTTFSISAWINVENINTFNPIISVYGSSAGTRKYLFRVSDSNSLDFFTYDESGVITGIVQESNALTVGTWHHVAATVGSGGDLELYLDGDSVATDTGNSNVNTDATADLIIGSRDDYAAGSSVNNFNGKIDQVRIFNTVLNSTQVGQLALEDYTDPKKSTTDYFGDGSGIALYELDEDANTTPYYPYGTGAIDSGQSAVFNGSSSAITNTNQVIPNGASSISFWYNPNGSTGTEYILGQGAATASKGVTVYYSSSTFGALVAKGTSSLAGSATTTTTYSNTDWHHVVATWDGTINTNSLKVYVNGSLEAQGTSDTSSASIGAYTYFAMGGLQGNTYAEGKIDQVRIYSSALSASDVEALVSETNVPSANLVAHYKLDGNANDETTNYNGTWGGTEAYSDPAEFPNVAYNGTPTNVNFLGMAFQPDFVWIKSRTSAYSSRLFDSVRGADISLVTDTNDPEYDGTGTGYLPSFDSNGFSLTSNTQVNQSSGGYVAWCWKAADTTTTIAANTVGNTIASDVRANIDAGFSIVKYTGNGNNSTIGHGLSTAPDLIITKGTDSVVGDTNWLVYNSISGATGRMFLNLPLGFTIGSTSYNDTEPTSSVFTIGTTGDINGNGAAYIAYCFHSVNGYQKVGSYTGDNPNTVTVDLGFVPRFIMTKAYASYPGASYWHIVDTTRDSSLDAILYANASDAEASISSNTTFMQPLSIANGDSVDGFSTTGANSAFNYSGANYIYLAIA